MSKPVHQFSPRMLRSFLQVRAGHATAIAATPQQRKVASRLFVESVEIAARITHSEMQLAWRGWLKPADTRTRLWVVLGLDPASHCVRLLDGGGQEEVVE